MAASPEVITQALAQVELGFAAFALGANSKRPVTTNGFKDATTDRNRVQAQLNLPIAGNYGITWPAERSDRVLVLDLDNGAEGRERPWQDRLLELIDRIGPLPSTKATTTPSGGRHAFYRWPSDVPEPAGDELFGFTVRWPGRGYLVGPGSSIDGRQYVPGPVEEIVDLPPAWVAAAVAEHRPHRRGGFVTIAGGRFEIPERITAGQRYSVIRDYVASRYNSGLGVDELWELVRSQVAPRFTVPLDDVALRDRFDRAVGKMAERLGPPRAAQGAHIPTGPLEASPLTAFDSRPVEWVWPAWLPRGVVTVMDGNPGVSKSTLVADLVARLSRGTQWPDGAPIGRPQRTVWITTEDDPGRVLRPRIEAAGGDPERVLFVRSEVVFPTVAGAFTELLVQLASEPAGLGLCVLDPLFSHIEATVRTIADAEMRRGVMNPLNDSAEAANCAVLVVRHFNKDTTATAINRGAGSLGGIVGSARALWTVVPDPEDEEEEQKVLGVSKLNYAELPRPMLYRVESRVPPGWLTGTVSGIDWVGEAPTSMRSLLSASATNTKRAVAILRDLVKDGPVASTTIDEAIAKAHIGDRAKANAKAQLGLIKTKQGMTGGWMWQMPDSEDAEESHQTGGHSSGDSSKVSRPRKERQRQSSGSSSIFEDAEESPSGALHAGARGREGSSGTCPECHRLVLLSTLGTIRSHYPDGGLADAKWGKDPCPGSTQRPMEASA